MKLKPLTSFLKEKSKKKPKLKPKARDKNIQLAAKGEINIGTRSVPDKTKYTRKQKHKNMEEAKDTYISEKTQNRLETLAGVKEDSYVETEKGVKFGFKNSLVANYCNIVSYHDKVIVEFRKQSDNIIEGTYDKLVSEEVIEINEFQEHFENITAIYLSYI